MASAPSIHEQLQAISDLAAARRPAGLHYSCPEQLVLDAGRQFTPIRLPSHIEPGPLRECFSNALECSLKHDLAYAEGFAITPQTGIVCAHAWCATDAGEAIDPTWPDAEQCTYLGVVIPSNRVLEIAQRTLTSGVLGNWRDGFSMLRQPFAA